MTIISSIFIIYKCLFQVNLPDGRIQTVTYIADHYGGNNAVVTYSAPNPLVGVYPAYNPRAAAYAAPLAPAPAYAPAPIVLKKPAYNA